VRHDDAPARIESDQLRNQVAAGHDFTRLRLGGAWAKARRASQLEGFPASAEDPRAVSGFLCRSYAHAGHLIGLLHKAWSARHRKPCRLPGSRMPSALRAAALRAVVLVVACRTHCEMLTHVRRALPRECPFMDGRSKHERCSPRKMVTSKNLVGGNKPTSLLECATQLAQMRQLKKPYPTSPNGEVEKTTGRDGKARKRGRKPTSWGSC
jgi:hypothetical protein